MQINEERRITRFEEKPKDPAVLDSMRLERDWYSRLDIEGDQEFFLASMGIYVFNREILVRLLDNTLTDFGKHIIPMAISDLRVFSYVFQGYWEDIGTIRNFFEANLDCTAELPQFNFFDMSAPIFSRPRFLPASKINGAQINHAIISDGCIINPSTISHSIVGIRSVVGSGSELHRVVLMGGDYYESHHSILENEMMGKPRVGKGYEMDYGPALSYTINCRQPGSTSPDNLVLKAVAVHLPNNACACFDTERLRYAAVWTNGFLDISRTHLNSSKGSDHAWLD